MQNLLVFKGPQGCIFFLQQLSLPVKHLEKFLVKLLSYLDSSGPGSRIDTAVSKIVLLQSLIS